MYQEYWRAKLSNILDYIHWLLYTDIFIVLTLIQHVFGTSSHVDFKGICIFRPPALCLAPNLNLPALAPQFVFTGPGPQIVFNGPGPQFVFTYPGPKFVFTCPDPKFLFTGPAQFVGWACIYLPCLPSNLYLLGLAYDFYYLALNLHLPSYLQ